MQSKLVALVLAFAPAAAAAAAPLGTAQPGRLPTDVVPIHYDIAIDPDAKALTFTGSETVTISVLRPTTTIVMNAADLAVGNVRLDGGAAPAQLTVDQAAQKLTIVFAKPVPVGAHRLAMTFSGKINTSAAGLFAVDYKDRAGEQRLLVTQFEAADGRRFAPLWDEPGRKATFTLSVVTPKGQTSFSNMPIATMRPEPDGKTVVTFQQTPKMSSYLLFLGQGDVERRTTKVGATEIGVITRRGAIDQGDYALASAARILRYYNDYFGTPYPLPKLDMIAAPGSSQFFSAMENWGAILYFDRAVLVDPKLSTETDRQNVFVTVAHEMAHQWFGDLVTMGWWDDIWLNEGFASWMETKATGVLNPDWHIAEQQIVGSRQSAFQADSRTGTHPIVQHIATPDEINQAFDAITYQKGEAVIRMLEGTVGEDRFREGVRAYMARYKYANTVTDDLWAAVARASGRPVKPLMDAFTLQPGVPLIRGGEPVCAAGRTTIPLAQLRYATDAASQAPLRWPVPVGLAIGPTQAQRTIAGAAAQPATIAGRGPLVLNPGQSGYFRTLYAPRHFAALSQAFAQLPLADQVGLLSDRAYLANAGFAPIDGMLAALGAVPADADPLVWTLVALRLTSYDSLLDGDPAQPAYRARAAALLAPQFAKVGFRPRAGEAPPVSQLREVLISTLGQLGERQVVDGARKLVAGGLDDLPAATREPVTLVFARNATPAEWETLHKAAQAERNPTARQSLYQMLGQAEDPALAQRALDLALTDEAPAPIRADIISSAAFQHPAMTFDWAVAHAAQVQGLIEASARQQFIPRLARTGNDAALAARLQAFVERTIPERERRAAQGSIANIRYQAAVKARARAPLAAWAGAQ